MQTFLHHPWLVLGNETKNVKVISDTINYKIDGRKKKSKKTFLIDLKSILGQKADGILGFKTFENRAHKIDYINKKIFFTKSHKNYEVLKMILKDDKLYIPINYIVEKKEYNGNFDKNITKYFSTQTLSYSTSYFWSRFC